MPDVSSAAVKIAVHKVAAYANYAAEANLAAAAGKLVGTPPNHTAAGNLAAAARRTSGPHANLHSHSPLAAGSACLAEAGTSPVVASSSGGVAPSSGQPSSVVAVASYAGITAEAARTVPRPSGVEVPVVFAVVFHRGSA